MARGWESKAVEEQMSAAEETQAPRVKRRLTDFELHQKKRKEALHVERTRLVRLLAEGHKRRYLDLLELALAHVDVQLAALASEEPEAGS